MLDGYWNREGGREPDPDEITPGGQVQLPLQPSTVPGEVYVLKPAEQPTQQPEPTPNQGQ
jgi:hypothetical protein